MVGAISQAGLDASQIVLLRVLRVVARGETWLPPAELGPVLRLLIRDQDERRGGAELFAALAPREREVLIHLAEGSGRRDVAERPHLSRYTVRAHLHSLMGKLGAHFTLEAVAMARAQLAQRSVPDGGRADGQ